MARGPSKFQRNQTNQALLDSLAAQKDAEEQRLNEAAERQQAAQQSAADAMENLRKGSGFMHEQLPQLLQDPNRDTLPRRLKGVFGASHTQFRSDLTSLVQSGKPFEDQLKELNKRQAQWGELSAADRAVMARQPEGAKLMSMYEDEQRRRRTEITLKQQQVERGATTAFKRDLDISASPTEIDASGNIRVRSTSEMIQGLSSHRDKAQAAYLAAQTDKDAVRTRIAAASLGTVGERLRRTQISQTREQSAEIAGLTDFMPTEVQPGMWTNPALATQRSAAARALQGAKQQLATLGPDALPEQQKTANELLKKMVDQLSRIDNTIKQGQQELEKAQIQSPFMSRMTARKEGEEDADYAKRISEKSAKWKGITGGVMSAVGTAAMVNAAFQQKTFDMPRRTIGAAAGIEGDMQSQILDSFSFSAASRVKFGGDVLYGDRTLGRSGYRLANQQAAQEMDRRRSAESSSMVGQGLTALGGAAMFLGGMAVGVTGVGAPVGIGMIAGGLAALGGAGMSAMDNTRIQEAGLMGSTMKGYAGATRAGQFQQAQQDILNSNMQRNKINVASQEALEGGLATYGQNIRMAGAWAVDPTSLVARAREVDQGAVSQAGTSAYDAYLKSRGYGKEEKQKYYYDPMQTGLAGKVLGVSKPSALSGKEASPVLRGGLLGAAIGLHEGDKPSAATLALAEAVRGNAEQKNRGQQEQDNFKTNVMNNRNSYFAQFGMGAEEWSTRISGVASRMGVGAGGKGAEAMTQNLYSMGLAGVGSFEQLSGNAEALANITGRADASGDLKRILTDAVKAGFDNSRTGQMFVQSTTALANSMGIRSTSGISQQLALGTRLLGGTEKDMEMMTRGMGGMSTLMDTNRTMGGLNFASFVAGGGLDLQGPLAQDAFDVSKNPQRALKVQADKVRIQKWKEDNAKKDSKGRLTNEAEDMYKMLGEQEFKDIDPAMRNALVLGGFGGVDKFSKAAMSGQNVVQAMGGQQGNIRNLMKQIDAGKMKEPEARLALERIMVRGQDMAGKLGVGEADRRAFSIAGLSETLGEGGQDLLKRIGITDLGDLNGQQAKGEAAAKAAATIQREQIAAKSALLAQGQTTRGRMSGKDLEGMADVNGKIRFMTQSGKGEQQEISLDAAQRVRSGIGGGRPEASLSGTEKAFADFLKENNKISAAMQQQMMSTLESVASGKTQEVVVRNWEDMMFAQSRFFGTKIIDQAGK